jgi:cell fate regulator YaaT (PSP1 superfamily)
MFIRYCSSNWHTLTSALRTIYFLELIPNLSPNTCNPYLQVHFKRAHRNFLLSPSAPRNILPGDFVKVEADRGEDLGVVVSKSLVEDFIEFVPTAGYRGRGYSAGLGEKKYIIRFATAEERMLLRNKVEDEERTLKVSCILCLCRCPC